MEVKEFIMMERRRKLALNLWNALILVGIITTIIVIFFNRSVIIVSNLAILPASYVVNLLISRRIFSRQPGLALAIIEIILFCRCIMIPMLYAFDQSYTGVIVYRADLTNAVWLISYEIISVGLAMFVWSKIKHKDPYVVSEIKEVNSLKYTTIFTILFFSFIIVVNAKLRGNLLNFSLLTREELGLAAGTSKSEYLSDIPGVFRVFYKIGLVTIMTTLVRLISNRKINKILKATLLILVCIGFISSMWTSGFSVSRWGMLIAAIISVYLLIYSFPEKKKLIISAGVVGIIVLILIGSLLKVFSFGHTEYTLVDSTMKYFNNEYFDEYFNGIAPVANGMKVAEVYPRPPSGIFVDTFYNFPYAMKIMGLSGETPANDLFRSFTGHYDLIMPTVTEGMMQFSILFAPTYSVILVLVALWCDRKLQVTNSLYKKIYYVVLVFWTSLFMAVNTNIIESNIWYAVIGIWLVNIEEKIRVLRLTKFSCRRHIL
ncbi:hypothetical protein GCM10008910_22890 [Faecalicatena orotica]|uniref:Oligosaccharide repeat unit polymerase n=1 Tax=Faecalicatena orotica TaxID=1544 RepID=A0A2Y9BN93_9FIRM|nr:hypothetical protein [Faecalicatena orotica]PWJ20729.1 hypothetical protein A8806_12145 [Faecalicatena orotica]SSA58528.1 hypothetical protein SAMN05216536_12145 [Faecalicatena orotica]